jgi:hypothetical protein
MEQSMDERPKRRESKNIVEWLTMKTKHFFKNVKHEMKAPRTAQSPFFFCLSQSEQGAKKFGFFWDFFLLARKNAFCATFV